MQSGLLYQREATSTSSSLSHHLRIFSALFFLNSCIHYLFYIGQKQPINHFAECRIPWAVATFSNCLRFQANDVDFSSGALSDLFSSLASRSSVSHGACSYCHSAQRNQEKYYLCETRLEKSSKLLQDRVYFLSTNCDSPLKQKKKQNIVNNIT